MPKYMTSVEVTWIQHRPTIPLNLIDYEWPFVRWGLDILGPFLLLTFGLAKVSHHSSRLVYEVGEG